MKNAREVQCIPVGCRERFIFFGEETDRLWPDREIDVAGISELTDGYRINRFNFPYHVILYVTRGALICDSGIAGVNTVGAGNVIYLQAETPHCYHAEEAAAILWFHLIPAAACWKKRLPQDCLVRPAEWAENIGSVLELLYSETAIHGSGDAVMQHLLCRAAVMYLHRELSNFGRDPEQQIRIRMLFKEVEENPDRPWNLREFARRAGMSVPNLFLAVRRIYGKSPGAMLQEIRMNTAARMLQYSDCKLDTIARKTGFSCGFALSRAFRRYYGASPAQWRGKTK